MRIISAFILSLLILFLGLGTTKAQSIFVDANKIDSLQKVERRPMIVFIHTNWCKYCQMMAKSSFTKAGLDKLISKKYYLISVDAEAKNAIYFGGKEFRFSPGGNNTGINELAVQLGTIDGELAYPSLCFLNDKYEIIYQKGGYASYAEVQQILKVLAMN